VRRGEKLAYYHRDGFGNVSATRLSKESLIVWALGGPNWKPGPKVWSLSPIWAQPPISNKEDRYTTPAEIETWHVSLLRKLRLLFGG